MAFKPRTTKPDSKDKCWILTSYGGYNKCIAGSPSYGTGSALANCVGYAYGRFLEIMRQSDPSITSCELPTCNAGDFLTYNKKYETGKVAKVGAIAVFAPCHVAIVEKIDANGVCTLSESGWGGPTFKYGNTISKANNYNDHTWGHYTCKGFIYNPYGGVSSAEVFVQEALKHVGERAADWTWPTYGTSNIEWCAAFVSAVAKTVGISGKCIYYTASSSGLARLGVKNNMGKFYKGPAQRGTHVPVLGDLILFRHTTTQIVDQYSAGHVGIVTEVKGNTVYTVEGNTSTNDKNTSKVSQKSYSVTASKISGYFHPDWSIVGSIEPDESGDGFYTSDLYDTATTARDMSVREIGYLNSKLQPSINSSDIKLSVINYTGVLAAAFKLVAPSTSPTGGSSVNTDGLEGNCKAVVDYLVGKGLTAASACGIAGNIYHESSFSTAAVGDQGTSFGICQWHNERGTAMKKAASPDWQNNLTGQLNYLWTELNSGYKKSTLEKLQLLPESEEGCRKAADIFVRNFEKPSNVDVKTLLRQATAIGYYNKVVIISSNPISLDDTKLKTQSGLPATIVRTIEVPTSVKQTGIVRNYTNYSYFYDKWSKNTIQRKLADIWGKQGKPQSRNIATINGYYLLAMSSKFATTGDIVTIELANGDKIHAILGDSKGADAGSPWGHYLGNAVDIVEWESYGNGQQGSTKIDLGSWSGQKVIRVHNRGSFLR